jgi:ATP-dependent helicase/nuclease subunit B
MAIECISAAYGPPAAHALRDAVARAKGDDPLTPVTVIVPTNYVGVAVRRQLAGGSLGPVARRGNGIAAVTFLTLYRMAELLGAPRLAAAGRRPVSTPVLAAAVRGVLTREPGRFAAVAEHPATEEALVASYRELSRCDADVLDALARTGARAYDLVRICRAVRASLGGAWYDEADLMDAAVAEIARDTPGLADLGAIVVYLPLDIAPAAARMLGAASAHTSVVVVAGMSGVARADAGVHDALARLGVTAGEPAVGPDIERGTRVVSVSDPDDEVRTVVRMVVDAMRDGVPLDRMAILFGANEPYARLVDEQLAAAGIPHNGAAVRTLAESVLGRALLALLALPDRDFHRHDVMALLASAPIRADGRLAPAARWERISRQIGIVRGGPRWDEQLERHARGLERQLAEELAVPDRDPRPGWFERELDATRRLQTFMRSLQRDLARGATRGASWRELVAWAQGLVRDYVAAGSVPEREGPGERRAWPEAEQQAADKVDAALERLAGLDAVEGPPGLDVFRRTLTLQLDDDLGRVGRLGDGILMGHVALGLGLDLDRVFLCGMAEGTFPARVRDDSLLPDTDRRATNGVLPLRAARVDADHARFLAAIAAAQHERVLLFPRGDLRRTTERMPSRFLLDTVEALVGTRLYADDLEHLTADWFTVVPSFASGIARVDFPATDQEYRLRALLEHWSAGGRVHAHELVDHDDALASGLACTLARASTAVTRFDGNLSQLAIPSPTADDVIVSPTRLESWARSPHDYLMQQVLRVEIPELPEETYELSHLDRGSVVHAALDEFLREVLARPGGAPMPGAAWSPADRARLREIAEVLCAQYEADGLTGRRVFWHRDKQRLLADLDRFLTRDDEERADHGLTTIATELRFGFRVDSGPAVEVGLSDGRTLRFRGAADRVDRAADGMLWVFDYKTGKPSGIDPVDPTSAGTRLQLPVYARAARAAFDAPDSPSRSGTQPGVGAAYWFVSTRGEFKWAELELTDAVEARVDVVLRAIVDGIERGVFPCRLDPPSSWHSSWRTFSDPDGRGTRDRYREWERKREAPEVAAYVALAEPDTLELGDGAEEPAFRSGTEPA